MMTIELSAAAKQEIDHWLQKYPVEQKRSALLAALTFVQTENGGYLTRELMDAVAAYLALPPIAVYEVAAFYSLFFLEPVGPIKIDICTNISCQLCDCEAIVKHVEKRLNIKLGETTPDQKITLRGVECLAACANAPAMQINGIYHENLTPEKIDKLLDEIK